WSLERPRIDDWRPARRGRHPLKESAMRWIRDTKLYLIAGVVILTASLLGAHYINNQPRNGNGEGQRSEAPANGQKTSGSRGQGAVCSGQFAPENEIIPLTPSVPGEV